MGPIEGTVLFSAILVALLAILCFQRRLLDALIEAINNFPVAVLRLPCILSYG